ncbi:hypothetical protein [Belliella buryatensis]|nr:hypothetical protein [Belliella buryatensis]
MDMLNVNFQSLELANQVTIQNIDNQPFPSNIEENSLLVKGNLYYYKIGQQNLSDGKVMESWLSYVLYAGLLKFRFKKTRYKINLGLSLREYYQNIRNYIAIKRQKKLSLFDGSKEISKTLDIVAFTISPNIYAQAIACTKITSHQSFIVLKFGIEDFEGIYYNPELTKEKQSYILGDGLGDHCISLNYDGPNQKKGIQEMQKELTQDAKIKKCIKQYFSNQIDRKISKLTSKNKKTPIIIIFEGNISEYIGEFIASLIKPNEVILKLSKPNTLASEGLYALDEFETYDAFNEKVGVSIGTDKTTFTSRKNNLLIS